jgi:hypothetical protein
LESEIGRGSVNTKIVLVFSAKVLDKARIVSYKVKPF